MQGRRRVFRTAAGRVKIGGLVCPTPHSSSREMLKMVYCIQHDVIQESEEFYMHLIM